MGAAGLADFLPDFATLAQIDPAALDPDRRRSETASPSPINVDDLVAAAVAKAEAEVTDRLSTIYEATLQAERENHEHELQRIQKEFGASAGATIANRLAEMETEIGELATSLTARILGSVLTDDLRKRSLTMLAKTITEAVRDNEAVRIQARGPQSLFEPLAEALGERAASVTYAEAPGFDLTVSIDGNLFETRLSEWSEVLEGALS